jgi:AhpD family alkylhydroperoxidase
VSFKETSKATPLPTPQNIDATPHLSRKQTSVGHHIRLNQAVPAAYKTLLTLSEDSAAAAAAAGLDPLLVELVKVRCSQINGCPFCLRMHIRDAVSKGETQDRLAVLDAWRDTEYFTPGEQDALAIAESTTLVSDRFGRLETELSALNDDQIAAVEWVTITINAFNRVAISSHFDVRH